MAERSPNIFFQSSIQGFFPLMVFFRWRLSSIKSHLFSKFPITVVFHWMSNSIKGVFHWRSCSIESLLLSKVVIHDIKLPILLTYLQMTLTFLVLGPCKYDVSKFWAISVPSPPIHPPCQCISAFGCPMKAFDLPPTPP